MKPDPKHMEMAMSLIKQQTIEFDPELYTDRYREALEKMLAEKQPETKPAEPSRVTDLMEALRLSIEKAKGKQKSA